MNVKQFRLAYLEGLMEGIRMYAIWKNGDQVVGCLQKPLQEVLQPYQDEVEELNAQGIFKQQAK